MESGPWLTSSGLDHYTLEDDPMDPENPWLVEENSLPWDQDVRVYVSFRECIPSILDRRGSREHGFRPNPKTQSQGVMNCKNQLQGG